MKYFKNYLGALAVFALVFTSCSKEETSAIDDENAEFVELTFGATLNDLANRAANKNHFDDVPACSDTAPDHARINFSYGGQDYEAVADILQDANGYYTDFSDGLKVRVNGGSTAVTLTGFLVYDSSNTIIWAAPVGDGFENYVDSVLPRTFNVAAGTKPYIDIEVLCFDRRMVNEYGYVFFDIVPDTIYPLCTFINYCNEEGRHWVANYSLDLYYGTNDEGIQLYDNNDADAIVSVGTRNGQYYADPLCLVVPGPPANLPNNQPYLYMVIHPNDWADNYGDISNSSISVQLSWNDVNALLNSDGTTNEYLHLLIGECDGALNSDGGGNGGGPTCNLSDPNADCDNDGTPNRCDADNPNWETFDCDGDGFDNEEDACPNQSGVAGGNGGDGCPDETTPPTCVNEEVCDIDDVDFPCVVGGIAQELGFVLVTAGNDLNYAIQAIEAGTVLGTLTSSYDNDDNLVLTITATEGFSLSGYVIEVRPVDSESGEMSANCKEFACSSNASGDTVSETFTNVKEGDAYYVRLKCIVCPPVLP